MLKSGLLIMLGLVACSAHAHNNVVVVPLLEDIHIYGHVPKTGQILCYADNGLLLNCNGSGQDGEFQKGVAWPTPRFTDNLDGTVTDNFTDLVWLKNANCIESLAPGFDLEGDNGDGRVSRASAFTFIENINMGTGSTSCGDTSNAGSHQTDWRLPNRFELESLLDIGEVGPALPSGHPFINVELDYYWSSSYNSFFAGLGVGWAVHFSAGDVESRSWTLEDEHSHVWPVRGGD